MPATPTMAMPSRRLRGRRLPSIREKPMAAMDAANNSNRAKVVRKVVTAFVGRVWSGTV